MYKNILVSALVNLGDVVLTTGALALIKKNFPSARITLMVKRAVSDAVLNNPVVDDVMILDYRARDNSLSKMLSTVRDIRRKRFDLYLSLDRKLRPALLAWLSRIPTRVGPSKVFDDNRSRVLRLYTDVVEIDHDLDQTLQARTYQTIVKKFFGLDGWADPVFARIDDESRARVDRLFERLSSSRLKIALCVKGTFELKTWSKEYFARVVKGLRAEYEAAFFIVGAPNDRAYADEVIKEINLPPARPLQVSPGDEPPLLDVKQGVGVPRGDCSEEGAVGGASAENSSAKPAASVLDIKKSVGVPRGDRSEGGAVGGASAENSSAKPSASVLDVKQCVGVPRGDCSEEGAVGGASAEKSSAKPAASVLDVKQCVGVPRGDCSERGAVDGASAEATVNAPFNPTVENFCGETTLIELAEIFNRVDLFITVDTGAAHIAATANVPMLTVYGCTSPDRWRPVNPNAVVFTSREPCCPCSVKPEQCPSYPNPDCLRHVTPEQVLDAARKLLNSARR